MSRDPLSDLLRSVRLRAGVLLRELARSVVRGGFDAQEIAEAVAARLRACDGIPHDREGRGWAAVQDGRRSGSPPATSCCFRR